MITCVLVSRAAPGADDVHPLESADTSSPQTTLQSFRENMHEAYVISIERMRMRPESAADQALVNRIMRCMDLSELAPAVRTSLGKEAAVCLKEVMDRVELPPGIRLARLATGRRRANHQVGDSSYGDRDRQGQGGAARR